jgi:hypothetical protein
MTKPARIARLMRFLWYFIAFVMLLRAQQRRAGALGSARRHRDMR